MKKKRLLSVFIILIYLFQFFNIVSYAEDVEKNNEAELLISLNIVSDKFAKQEKVTRGDFAIAIAKAFNTGFEEDYYASENPFADLYKYEPYSGIYTYLKGYGIITGDQNNKFNKKKAITAEEAYSITLRALGYTVDKDKGYTYSPSNLAGSLKLNVSKAAKAEISGEDAVHILYKMLFVKSFFAPNANLIYRDKIQGSTFLNYYWDISEVIGVVNSDGTMSVQKGVEPVRKNVLIGTTIYDDSNNLAYGMAGYRVKAYVTEEDELCCIQKFKNEEIEILSENLISPYNNDFKIKYYNKNSKKSIDLSKKFSLVHNGIPADDISSILPSEGSVKLVDNDNDGKYDVVFSNEWKYMFVELVNRSEQKIVDQNNKSFVLDCDAEEELKTVNIVNSKTNEPISIDDIGKDAVLRCITDKDQINIIAYLNIESVFGTITDIDIEEREIEIDGVVYKFNGYYNQYYSSYNIGTEGEFYIADNRTVTALKINKELIASMRYGYLIKSKIDEIEQNLMLTIITEEGSKKSLTVRERCVIDGKRERDVLKTSVTDLFFKSNGDTKFQLIRYSEEEGICLKIDTIQSNFDYAKFSSPVNTNDILQSANARAERKYKSFNGLFLPTGTEDSFRIVEDTIVFYVPSSIGTATESATYDVNDFQVGSMFKNDKRYTVESYNIDKSGAVGAVIAYAAVKPEVSSSSSYGVIYKANNAYGEMEDIITKKIVYYDGNRFNTVYLSEKAMAEVESTGVEFKKGDVVRLDLNRKGLVEAINIDYSHSRGTVFPTSGEDAVYEITKLVPKYIQDGYMIGYNGTTQYLYKIDGAPIIHVDESNPKEMASASLDCIKCSGDYGSSSASEVILIMQYSSPKLLVVYNRVE